MATSALNHQSQSLILLINVKMSTIVGILTFMSRIIFMLSSAENEKRFITVGPNLLDSTVGRELSMRLIHTKFWQNGDVLSEN